MRIHQLPAIIANQIAAGEVIERPASVVKELLENSLDAKATHISIELGFAGLNQIKISDDGVGIFADDLPLAISAHATSKITELNDLYNISSMGFRGEALASIASVSRLKISSRPESQKHATMLTVMDDDFILSPCARTPGTTIEVDDLFYNAPVRKKFLKTERAELQAIEEVVKRFALSSPEISITLQHNGKKILNLPTAKCDNSRRLRIKKILGSRFIDDSIEVNVESSSIALHGLLGRPSYQRSQRDKQWIYVNNRMVKDKLLQHAVTQAYQDVIDQGRYPVCLLYLDMPSCDMDVNVHPTKHELRFQDPRMVHDFLVSSIITCLGSEVEVSSPLINNEPFIPKDEVNEFYTRAPLEPSTEQDLLEVSHILNDSFALVYKNSLPYLMNLAEAHKQYSSHILNSQVEKLPSRPLLVPINYEIESSQYALFEDLAVRLLKYGIGFDFVSANRIIIRTIPQALPLLDIKLLFNRIGRGDLGDADITKLIAESQVFDAFQTSSDEQAILIEYLIQKNTFTKYCIHLSSSTCSDIFKDV
ncbi:MAG: DNA mismatch repair endonuclease MutL [Legionellaceae bacterium]|nr:DNA mismatch repair endonuclease MutL [Legionellaceae bacterium]